MSSNHVAWNDRRAEHVARAGGEEAVEAGKRETLAEVIGPGSGAIAETGDSPGCDDPSAARR